MSPVSAVDAISQNNTSGLYTTHSAAAMGKQDFLNLLIAQLQHQDPLNPQDPSEFTAQLTQFSNLEQMISLNESVQNLQLLQIAANNTMTASLIGKDILYAGDGLQITETQAAPVRFYVPSAAASVTVRITNETGQTVRTLELGSYTAGTQTVSWDGKDSSGNTLPAGKYHMTVTARDSAANSIDVVALSMGRATGMQLEDGTAYLDVGGQRVALNQVYSVLESTQV